MPDGVEEKSETFDTIASLVKTQFQTQQASVFADAKAAKLKDEYEKATSMLSEFLSRTHVAGKIGSENRLIVYVDRMPVLLRFSREDANNNTISRLQVDHVAHQDLPPAMDHDATSGEDDG